MKFQAVFQTVFMTNIKLRKHAESIISDAKQLGEKSCVSVGMSDGLE